MSTNFRADMLIPHDEMLGITTTPYTEEEIERTSYRPTIIIGLGGTGYDVVRKLKRRIESHFGFEKGRIFQYLVIDTAPEKPPAGEVPLGPSVFVHLKSFPAAQMIENLSESDPIKKWWVEPHLPTYTGNGAGAIRPVGRMVLFRYANTVIKPRLFEKIKAAVDIASQEGLGQRGVKIYIVGSLAGGTCSGQFLDVAYMARNEVASLFPGESFVTGIFVMPSAFLARAKAPIERQRWQANGYAALRELDLANAKKSFSQDYGGGYRIGRMIKGMKPFNICYLISLFNENNQALSGYDSLTEMISEEMMLEIASPLQGEVNNMLDNIQETDSIREGHPYAYSSFSVASLLYPLRGVASWCGLKFESPFINNVLLRPLKPSEDAEEQVNSMIDDLNLREEGADQVINALNKNKLGKDLPVSELEYAVFEGVPDNLILDSFQRETQSCLEDLDVGKREIAARLQEMQLSTPNEIRKRVNRLLKHPERGPEYVEWFLTALEAKLKAYRSENMLVEQSQYQNQFMAAQSELNATQDEIERAIGLPRVLPWRSHQIEQSVNIHVSTFNTRVNSEHQVILRENAVSFFTTLLETVSLLTHQVRELIATFKSEAQAAEAAAEQARVRLKVTQSDFSLVKSIVDEKVLLETYDKFKPVYQSEEEKRQLNSSFWQFVAKFSTEWELGRDDLLTEGISSQPFYYLGELIGRKLATIPILERMKERTTGKGSRKREVWREEIAERYTQAAAFWNVALVKNVSEVERNLRRSPNLVGYGENDLEVHWSEEVNRSLPEEITPVQTKNNQELIFLKTVHGLPLFAVYEAEADLKNSYELLQYEWKNGQSDLPVHASRVWEREVIKRDKDLVINNGKKPVRQSKVKKTVTA